MGAKRTRPTAVPGEVVIALLARLPQEAPGLKPPQAMQRRPESQGQALGAVPQRKLVAQGQTPTLCAGLCHRGREVELPHVLLF